MVDNRTLFDLADTLAVTERWLDAGNAHKSTSVAVAIEEFKALSSELKDITKQPEHSMFTVADIRELAARLLSITERLEQLPIL